MSLGLNSSTVKTINRNQAQLLILSSNLKFSDMNLEFQGRQQFSDSRNNELNSPILCEVGVLTCTCGI